MQHMPLHPRECLETAIAAIICVASFLEALPDELPGCEGNAFYALHR